MELRNLARWLNMWVERRSPWEQGLIALGDANIDEEGSRLYTAFTSTGLVIPDDLKLAPRMVTRPSKQRMYSQIAWFRGKPEGANLPFAYSKGGSFDFGESAMRSRNLDRRKLRDVISDHLPLWAEFSMTGPAPSDSRSAESAKPRITDPPPPEIADELEALDAKLDQEIPGKQVDRNLLICTWNIRAFGDLTEKWYSEPGDRPQRDLHSLLAIAAIMGRFDVVALQEAKSNSKALRAALRALGPNWSLMLSDVTKGDSGNDERIGFLFDTRRVSLSGLACELVVPQEQLEEDHEDALREQFARTPYAVGFRCLDKTFTLVSLHVLWGKVKQRVPELRAIAHWLRDWARDKDAWDRNLIVLGDTNITSRRSKLYRAFTSSGLHIPKELFDFPRTITTTERNLYDQIAWFDGQSDPPALDLEYSRCGTFDFAEIALRTRNLDRTKLSHMISDHLPLWVEFDVRP